MIISEQQGRWNVTCKESCNQVLCRETPGTCEIHVMALVQQVVAMTKRKVVLVASFTCIISLLLLWHSFHNRIPLPPPSTTGYSTPLGSSYISKSPEAQDKVIVMAKMSAESVDWATNELQE